jgi:hypothetical protein
MGVCIMQRREDLITIAFQCAGADPCDYEHARACRCTDLTGERSCQCLHAISDAAWNRSRHMRMRAASAERAC